MEAGAPLDQVTEAGLYGAPLHYAAGKGFTEIIEILLRAGADKNCLSEDNCTPLYYAVLGGRVSHFTAGDEGPVADISCMNLFSHFQGLLTTVQLPAQIWISC